MYISISLDTCYKTAEKVQILIHAEPLWGGTCTVNIPLLLLHIGPGPWLERVEDPVWG